MFAYRPFISSVGQSLFKPHGCSVVPTIRPNINPNTNEISIPAPRAANPLFWAFFVSKLTKRRKKKWKTKENQNKNIKKERKSLSKRNFLKGVVVIKWGIHWIDTL